MTGLDETTLLVISPTVQLVVGALYVLNVWRRGRPDVVDRCWTLPYLAAIVTTFAYLASDASPALWWAVALGNASFVLALGAIWAGARAREARRPLLWVVVASAGVAALAVLVEGPDGGPWAGGLVYLLAIAVWGILAAVELVGRSHGARRSPEAVALGLTCAVAGAYYATRAVAFAAGGPESELFARYLPTSSTTLINLLLILVGAFAMMALRTREIAEVASVRYDPVLGTRTLPYLLRTVAAREGAGRVQVLALRLRDAGALRDAFGRGGREDARRHLADVVLDLLPTGGAAATDASRGDEMVVVLPADADGAGWLRGLRRALLDHPLRLDGDTVGLDVGSALAVGPARDVEALVRTARSGLGGEVGEEARSEDARGATG
ncbi:hypothetical protein [Puerhibacterium puerhi]|uniref:hypothetical protein n=1 Tax=Puerhibacterium puerhi TaxID=2692623 RepID=UPI00135A0E06|nr:hypothetical protein [Puerhibacterium puerhi]